MPTRMSWASGASLERSQDSPASGAESTGNSSAGRDAIGGGNVAQGITSKIQPWVVNHF
jgi:hypothetical protein